LIGTAGISVPSRIHSRTPALPVLVGAAIASAALLSLPFIIRLDGKPHSEWLQFVGRFHPLLIHIPIGLLVLVPVLELAGYYRPSLHEAAKFVLLLAVPFCFLTSVLGYMLAYGAGDTGTTVTRHMWGAIALSVLVCWSAVFRLQSAGDRLPRVYASLLGSVLLALFWTAHQGGSLTHGSDYLTRYMPSPLKRFFGHAAVVPAADSFYARRIHPILDARCVGCHGESKTQGGLHLDSYDALMRGGKDGAVIVPGNPEKSMLITRVSLPSTDKRFMPAEGRPPLKPEEIAVLKAWIRQGASSSDIAVSGAPALANTSDDAPPKPVGDYSGLMAEIEQMRHAQGAKLVPVSNNPADGLVLETVDVANSFGDAQLVRFAKFAPYIVEADLDRTGITDASFDTLSQFTQLRALHLAGTAVTGAGLARLNSLSELRYLNLSETRVTSSALQPLKAMSNLTHVYLFNTPAQPATKTAEIQTPEGAHHE
jgi:uncharacterized membrane protein